LPVLNCNQRLAAIAEVEGMRAAEPPLFADQK
jgi:hypothetical protein